MQSARIGQDRSGSGPGAGLGRRLSKVSRRLREMGFGARAMVQELFRDSRCTPGQAGTHWPRPKATEVSEKDFSPGHLLAERSSGEQAI